MKDSDCKELVTDRLAKYPFCNVCNKLVDEISVDFGIRHEPILGRHYSKQYSGRFTTFTIKCHGETFSKKYDRLLKEWVD